MTKIIRIGLDTSKRIFQAHGVDAAEKPILRKRLRRSQLLEFFRRLEPTEIGMEACGGAHYWARELSALGHQPRLVPAQYAKAYVKRNKNDAADAEAICEAMSRPSMRFVPVKTVEQQAALMLAGTRDGLIRRQTQLGNAIRGYAAEFGLTASKGLCNIAPLLARVAKAPEENVPHLAKQMFAVLAGEFVRVRVQVTRLEALLKEWHKSNETSLRLAEVDGIGPVSASLAVMKTDPHAFGCARDYSAWIGLTPKDHSTAGKKRLGRITRAGDEALRSALVVGATSVISQVRHGKGNPSPWLRDLVRRKPPKLAAVALANKNARIAWKLMVSGERYDRARCGRTWGSQQAKEAAAPTACMVTSCSPPSRPLRAASGGGLRPALTAAAPGVTPKLQVGTKKRFSGRTKKLGQQVPAHAATATAGEMTMTSSA